MQETFNEGSAEASQRTPAPKVKALARKFEQSIRMQPPAPGKTTLANSRGAGKHAPKPAEEHRKCKRKKEKHLEESGPGMRQALGSLPNETKGLNLQNGTRLYQLVGHPCDIDGDFLLVFSNGHYKIHNKTFRKALMKAGWTSISAGNKGVETREAD